MSKIMLSEVDTFHGAIKLLKAKLWNFSYRNYGNRAFNSNPGRLFPRRTHRVKPLPRNVVFVGLQDLLNGKRKFGANGGVWREIADPPRCRGSPDYRLKEQ